MKDHHLRSHLLLSFFLLILFIVLIIGVFAYYFVQNDVISRGQRQVTTAINSAQSVYSEYIDQIGTLMDVAGENCDLNELKKTLDLDYIYEVPAQESDKLTSEIARKAAKGEKTGGTRIIAFEELKLRLPNEADDLTIKIIDTPKSRPCSLKELKSVMAIEYAIPIYGSSNEIKKIRCAGRIINKDFSIIDRIHGLVFEKRTYKNKPTGTVTIFQDDVRISTNVLNNQNKRAIGTRVSQEVYQKTVLQGRSFRDRAFVVTDWYLTHYEPIKNINDEIIGILYVGILEMPFNDLKRNVLLVFGGVIVLSVALAFLLAYFLVMRVVTPVENLIEAKNRLSEGDLEHRISIKSHICEFNQLFNSFNQMAEKVHQRDITLQSAKERAEDLNRRYVDLLGFVSHEFKGILSSVILNVYSLRQGLLGPVSPVQETTLDSIANNLDYLTGTVKNFLNLSRLENNRLETHKSRLHIKANLFDVSLEAFYSQIKKKNIEVINNIEPEAVIEADPSLMQVVANNLVNNAVKYGREDGRIILSSKQDGSETVITVYNDGKPISEEDIGKLFKKFSRVLYEGMEKIKGSGIGLFITKEIIEKHGGRIWVEPGKKGNSFIFTLKS
ncbi:Sensor kinase CusS [Limihaloglobus sulfuriphilus]|uniref:histidine kinase n=1 Tax=Limihaloglobus sulfuriphilus TaxID=1851148 RepID=A0A1Q2MBR3_9BACT|nr:cache domain-containing protein [Limihaloglobus sulfuriphilus]AQQ69717.1 Sensor kinase CusS [Limihaloglobus sulfuriphilus]